MAKQKVRKMPSTKNKAKADEYSLWTSPPSEWNSPFDDVTVTKELELAIQGLAAVEEPEDPRLDAFQTPVTAETLAALTQS